MKKYNIVNFDELNSVQCPCGTTKRAFLDDPDKVASMHIVEIKKDSELHYHEKMTEIYYILDGVGEIELDGRVFKVSPGMAVMIKPGCRHRAVGKLRILNIPVPAFDPNDEFPANIFAGRE